MPGAVCNLTASAGGVRGHWPILCASIRPPPAKTDLLAIDPQTQLVDEAGRDDFHSRVAKILFFAKRTRQDLLTTVSFLSTCAQNPTSQDLDKL